MRIVQNQEMRELDRRAIEDIGIPSLVLMENAGLEAARLIHESFPEGEILIFCGKGKNGGDGLVVARHLMTRGRKVRIFLCNEPKQFTAESAANLRILQSLKCKITVLESANLLEEYFRTTPGPHLIVDGILGTGLDRDLEGLYFDVVELMNRYSQNIIALDIPSGVMGDSGRIAGVSVHAEMTISFGFPRLGHLLAPGAARRGKLYNVDLGFPRQWSKEGEYFLLTKENTAPLLKKRDRFAHKNTFGHCLLVGASPGKLGALVMASHSCLRMGAGLVTAASWEHVFPSLEMMLPPEVMTYRIKVQGQRVQAPDEGFLQSFSSVVLGPGLGTQAEGAVALKYLLERYQGPLVVDADGLNLIAEHRLHDLLLKRPVPPGLEVAPTILTPHPGEMARLLGVSKQEILSNPIEALKRAVELTGSIVVLKGPTTMIHSPEGRFFFNHYPNDGMAKGGSGDVLAGMMGGLLGQKVAPLDTACLAVFIHALAGARAAEARTERSMTATDVISHIQGAFEELQSLAFPPREMDPKHAPEVFHHDVVRQLV